MANARLRSLPAQWDIAAVNLALLIQGLQAFYAGVRGLPIIKSPSVSALKTCAVPLLQAATNFRPAKPKEPGEVIFMFGGSSYGPRPRLNAAGALTVFKTRKCSRVHDLMAIMANLCGYDIRLDTVAVRKHCRSIRAALLTQAILNGDMSLFIPELYTALSDHGRFPVPEGDRIDPTSLPIFHPSDQANAIHYFTATHGYRIRPRLTRHTSEHDEKRAGLPFSAYLWDVDGEMDLSIVRDQFSGFWQELKAPCDAVNDDVRDEPLSPFRIEGDEDVQRKLAEIVFSILRYLHGVSSTDPRAAGVANSIWQSIRRGEK